MPSLRYGRGRRTPKKIRQPIRADMPSFTPIAAIQWSATMPSSTIVRALGLATLALFFLGAFTPLPTLLYEMITVPVHIERADAIVVLAGGGVLASGVRRLILVTDGTHMRRAMGLARDAGFDVLAAPVSEVETPTHPEPRLRLLRAALREGLALVYYHIAGYL